MILDNIKNADAYYALGENFKAGFEFIKNNNLKEMATGEYEIIEGKVRANIQEYTTKDEGLFEAHRKYVDIQYVISNKEIMEVVDVADLEPNSEYNVEKDYQFFNDSVKSDALKVEEGYFTVFFPQDAHKPCMKIGKNETVKKVVIKILI